MAQERKIYTQLVSPRGTFKFPKISEIDYGTKDYPKPDGEFSVRLVARASDPAVQAFIAKLQPIYEEAMKAAQEAFAGLKAETRKKLKSVTENQFYTELLDKETEEPTGEVEFKFAMGASGEVKDGPRKGKKWFRRPDVYDAKGQAIVLFNKDTGEALEGVPKIWGGTIGKISAEVRPYFISGSGAAGIKLALMGVQVIDLVSGGQRSAARHGFGVEDGGYEHESAPAPKGGFADESEGVGAPSTDDF